MINIWGQVGGVTYSLPLETLLGTANQLLGMNSGATAAQWKDITYNNVTDQLAIPTTGNVAAPSYVFQGDLSSGWYRPAANQWAWSAAGVQKLLLASAGIVFSTPIQMSSSLIKEDFGVDIAAANGTTDVAGATGNFFQITNAAGAKVITSLGGDTIPSGTEIETYISITGGTINLTNDPVGLILLGGANLALQNGDVIRWRKINDASPYWRMVGFQRGVSSSGFTNKGDWLLGAGGGNTLILPVGADGTVPVADSTQGTGVRWGAAAVPVAVRQAIQAGLLDSNGFNNLLSAGAGLKYTITAAAVAAVFSFAGGFSSTGNVDYITRLIANKTNVGALAASNTNYDFLDYISGSDATPGNTLAPPQYGYAYDRTAQSVLQFAGATGSTVFLCDYGNTWAAQGGAKVQTNYFKFGTGALGGAGATNALNGAADYVKSTNFTSLGPNGWALRCWTKPLNALPGAGTAGTLIAAVNAGGFGAYLQIYNNAGTIKFTYTLSSTGAGQDIANLVQGTTTPVLGTEYFVELTFDALAGVYRLYVNGIQEQSTASALKICAVTGMGIGATNIGTSFYQGYIDKPEFLPYCQNPGGTAYTPPLAAPSVTAAGYSSDFFSIPDMQMYNVSVASTAAGSNPTFVAVKRLYIGEQDTNGGAVTATRNYAIRGQYRSAQITFPAAATRQSFSHNLGYPLVKLAGYLLITTAIGNYPPGTLLPLTDVERDSAVPSGSAVSQDDRNTAGFIYNTQYVTANKTTAARTNMTPATNGKLILVAERGW